MPDLIALITGPVVVFDHLRRSLTIVAPCPLGDGRPRGRLLAHGRDRRRAARAARRARCRRPPEREREPVLGPVTSNVSREDFEAGVERAREYIFAGDAFQVVPSQRFSAPMALDPFAVYRGLRTVNPSPYMFFLETDEVTLVGSSPEMLVKVEGGAVEMHPIAGSRPRGADEAEDQRLGEELLADPKERAEHVMLVDLGRNDLGRVSEIGTVHGDGADGRAPLQPRDAHRELGGRAPGRRAAGVGRPAGDLPGRARSPARPRCARWRSSTSSSRPSAAPTAGRSAGSAGTASLDTCITIRTIVCRDGVAHVQAGAGIVADSVPATEYEETQNKAAALFRAIEVAAGQEDW